MARLTLNKLTPKARIAYPMIKSGVRSGLSYREIQSALKKSDLGIVTKELSYLINYERELIEHGKNLRFLPRNRKPNISRLPTSITAMRKPFMFNIQVFGYDAVTGSTFARYINVLSNVNLTRQQAEDAAVQMIMSNFEMYKMEIESTQLVYAQKSATGFVSV